MCSESPQMSGSVSSEKDVEIVYDGGVFDNQNELQKREQLLIEQLKDLFGENEKNFQNKEKELKELSSRFKKYKLQSRARISSLSNKIKKHIQTSKELRSRFLKYKMISRAKILQLSYQIKKHECNSKKLSSKFVKYKLQSRARISKFLNKVKKHDKTSELKLEKDSDDDPLSTYVNCSKDDQKSSVMPVEIGNKEQLNSPWKTNNADSTEQKENTSILIKEEIKDMDGKSSDSSDVPLSSLVNMDCSAQVPGSGLLKNKDREIVNISYSESDEELSIPLKKLASQSRSQKNSQKKEDCESGDTSSTVSADESYQSKVIFLEKELEHMKQEMEIKEKHYKTGLEDYKIRINDLEQQLKEKSMSVTCLPVVNTEENKNDTVKSEKRDCTALEKITLQERRYIAELKMLDKKILAIAHKVHKLLKRKEGLLYQRSYILQNLETSSEQATSMEKEEGEIIPFENNALQIAVEKNAHQNKYIAELKTLHKKIETIDRNLPTLLRHREELLEQRACTQQNLDAFTYLSGSSMTNTPKKICRQI